MNFTKNITFVFAVFLCLVFSLNAAAAVPATMTYHGALNDAAGQPVNATVEASFQIFDAETGGTKAWNESMATIDVNNGSFSVQLGATSPLTNVFDGKSYWLEVSINGEALSPRTPIESVPYALRANSADNASKLEGKTSAEIIASAQSGGAASAADIAYDNGVSGLTATNIQAALDELAALRARVAALETASGSHATTIAANTGKINTNTAGIATNAGKIATNTAAIATNGGKITTNTAAIATNGGKITTNTSAIATNTGKITTNTSAIATNGGKITVLETLTQNMKRETINGKLAVTFTGVNVHVRSGTGSTGGTINGLGNLIVGYDEARSTGTDKSGSHNIIIGTRHNYPSYGGLVVGYQNTIDGDYSSVTGGTGNKASNSYTWVGGGTGNTASGQYSSVSGGQDNTASGYMSSVSGGTGNVASGQISSISGGSTHVAFGNYSSISGGNGNRTNGSYASVSGGQNNTAVGDRSSISGGNLRQTHGSYNWRAGNLFENQ